MTIFIPLWVVLVLLAIVVWWTLGYVVNSTLVKWVYQRQMRKRRTSVVPRWAHPVMCLVCGPVGWLALLFGAV